MVMTRSTNERLSPSPPPLRIHSPVPIRLPSPTPPLVPRSPTSPFPRVASTLNMPASASSPSLGPTGKPPLSPPKPPIAIPVATPAPITTAPTTPTPTPPTITPATLLSHAHLHHPIPTKVVGYGSLPHPTTPRAFHHDRSMSASGSMLSRPMFTVHKRQHSNHMSLLNLTADAMMLKHAQQLQSLSIQGTLSAQLIQPIPTIVTTTTTTTTSTSTSTEGPNLAKLAFQRKWDDVRDMILKGWNCNERYGAMGGWTAAHEACLHNRHDILQLLYDHGGDMTTQNQSGNTPLHVTCMSDSAECTKLLLDWGVPIHVKNKWNATPFDFAKNRTIRSMLEAKLTPEERTVLESIRDENIRVAAQTTKRKKPSDELMLSDENESITSVHDTNMNESTTHESQHEDQSPFKKPTHTRNASSLSMDTLTLDTTKRVRHSISEDTRDTTTAFSTTFLSSTKPTPSSTSTNPTLCIVCNNKQKAIMYHPCCHVACCTSCDTFQTRCPMCNTSIGGRKTISL